MMFQLAYGGSPFPSPEGLLFSLPTILAPAWGILSGCDGGMIRCSSLDGLFTRLMDFNRHTAVRISLHPRVEIDVFSIRIRPFVFPSVRRSRLMMFQSEYTAVRLSLRPRVDIDDVSIRIRLFAFPSTRGSRLMMFQSEYDCSPLPPLKGRD